MSRSAPSSQRNRVRADGGVRQRLGPCPHFLGNVAWPTVAGGVWRHIVTDENDKSKRITALASNSRTQIDYQRGGFA